MSHLLFVLLLQLITISTFGQSTHRDRPDSSSKQPDAVVQSLYRKVIARHPLGIPSGENWKVFAPYLSKGLLHRVNLAKSCQDDWVRQNKGRMVKEPFAWGETGIFSGDEELSEPSSFRIERTETKQDGSFQVEVKLTGGAPKEKPWNWEVGVRVVVEERRLVVDDVAYLKGEEVHSEYHLSELLMKGCDGPRWIGYGKQQSQPK